MGLKCVRLWLMLIFTFISLQGWKIEGCLKQERFALLQLKRFFNNWVEGDGNSNCCDWRRVECNNTTGKVISLDLSYTRNQEMGEWYLNVSLFSPFHELERLDLSGNLIAGCIENEGFERLSHLSNLVHLNLAYNMFNDIHVLSVSRLSNLEYLRLSGNIFNNSILSYVSTLSSLKQLHLYDIGLKGIIDLQELDSLSNLEELSMGENGIKKIVFSKGETSLRKLNAVYLSDLIISDGNRLFRTLGLFPSLKSIELWFINFTGAVTTYDMRSFKNLESLSMYETLFNNSFYQIIGAMTSLQNLTMWDCTFKDTLLYPGLPTSRI
ncbi:receptor-like protein 9a isoform X2 [Pistacia vera]|uniref:receptor-like protein 9a isoform X2 n=1 Tax=Pistacia vera TaxID=55513 RepID=UPI001263BE0F|nr:receptor-like protein 9a isoform X2 [Pistacia vera]